MRQLAISRVNSLCFTDFLTEVLWIMHEKLILESKNELSHTDNCMPVIIDNIMAIIENENW